MQNYSDWARYEAQEQNTNRTAPATVPDAQVYADELRLGRLVEGLGFDSLWTVEHHFTPYTMVNSPLPLLNYFAGCTSQIDMGTMVIVLPWHDPIRVAEEIVMLDHLLDGRKINIGLGRGLGRREFSGLRISMNESRSRFQEAFEIVRATLTNEWFSYEGEHFVIPETTLRPRPRSDGQDLVDRMYVAWGSPQTMPAVAPLGLKPLFIPQTSWAEYANQLHEFTNIRVSCGYEPTRPTVACWVYCAASDEAAWDGASRYLPEYADSALRHYEIMSDHFAALKGYEHYAASSDLLRKMHDDGQVSNYYDTYLTNHVWGSPETCVRKLTQINEMMGPDQFVAVMKFGSMPAPVAEQSMRLFAREVLPTLKSMPAAPFPLVAL